MPCNTDELAEAELFELLNRDDLIALSEVIDSQKLNENEILFHAGAPGDSLFIVQSGEVELFIKDTAGQKILWITYF